MEPTTFDSSRRALEAIQQGGVFDIGILDMQMPEMDGVGLAREIRAVHSKEELPLIMLSSIDHSRDPEASSQALFHAKISKPIKQSLLFDTLIGAINSEAPAKEPTHFDDEIDHDLAQKLPLKILLAEDNAVNQKLAVRILEKMGYNTDVVANGFEALEFLKRQAYDIVFMDMQMPEMDGLEVTRHIVQEWSANQRPKIIAMTANTIDGDRERCIEAGMDDYISKPLAVGEIQMALQRWVLADDDQWYIDTFIQIGGGTGRSLAVPATRCAEIISLAAETGLISSPVEDTGSRSLHPIITSKPN